MDDGDNMTIGIYSITHTATGKRYIGKSVNVENRLWQHKHRLNQPVRHKDCNRHLWNAVQKHGWEAFNTEVLETFAEVDEALIAERELWWMDHYDSCNRNHGYNLRRDSATRMIVHEETRELNAQAAMGFNNPNFANYWTYEQKARMSEIAKARHASGEFYGDDWKARQSEASKRTWSDAEKRQAMAEKVSIAKQKYDYLQLDREGRLIRRWSSVKEIVAANPGYKWQNIYNVCHGHKPTYMGFIWRQVERSSEAVAA